MLDPQKISQQEKLRLIMSEIEATLFRSFIKNDLPHGKLTLELLLKLNPETDDALEVAALGHDIERSFRSPQELKVYDTSRISHEEESARKIRGMLITYGFDLSFIDRVEHLILHHEKGIDEDTDLLMDCDSLALFLGGLEGFFEDFGPEVTMGKIQESFERMTERGKDFLRQNPPMYNNPALNQLFEEVTS